MGTTARWSVFVCAAIAGGCGTASDRIDPRDLELRDLLGISPEIALAWDPAQRAAAREVLAGGLDRSGSVTQLHAGDGRTFDERISRALAALDRQRAADGEDALGLVRADDLEEESSGDGRAALAAGRLEIAARRAPATLAALAAGDAGTARIELWLANAWDAADWSQLPARGLDALSSIALDGGHRSGPVVVAPWPRLGVIAGYAAPGEGPPRLLVNPVLLASLEPAGALALEAAAAMPRAGSEAATSPGEQAAPRAGSEARPELAPVAAANTAGNPYSFYGSIAECAFAQRTRCESCVAGGSTCRPITNISDGVAECNQLAAGTGRGFFLLCINLGLAISSVDACTKDAAPGCPRDNDAARTLAELEANASFLDDATCGGALDGCLAEIYGPPPDDFPGPGSGDPPPPRPPRETSIDCGDSCSSDNSNCEASPSCDCEGPSCSNSFSCDSACSSSNSGGGCGGCDGCSDSGGGGGGGCSSDSGGGGGGGCSSDSGSGGGGCSSDSGSGGGCGGDSGGCGGDGGSGGGGCGGDGGGCSGGGGGGCSSGGGGGGCSSSGGGGGGCNVARRHPPPGAMWLVSIAWACLPLPISALIRRRARARRERGQDPAGAGSDAGSPAPPALEGSGNAPTAGRGEEVAP